MRRGRLVNFLETPPRAWGRHPSAPEKVTNIGNTPTGVGKTFLQMSEQQKREKHPHGRGEDKNPEDNGAYKEETPPRAWGRHYLTGCTQAP